MLWCLFQVVREKQINDVRASLGSNKIEKFCSGVHQIENEISNDDHKAQKRNCGNQKVKKKTIILHFYLYKIFISLSPVNEFIF